MVQQGDGNQGSSVTAQQGDASSTAGASNVATPVNRGVCVHPKGTMTRGMQSSNSPQPQFTFLFSYQQIRVDHGVLSL